MPQVTVIVTIDSGPPPQEEKKEEKVWYNATWCGTFPCGGCGKPFPKAAEYCPHCGC